MTLSQEMRWDYSTMAPSTTRASDLMDTHRAELRSQTHFDAFTAVKTDLVATSFNRLCAMQ